MSDFRTIHRRPDDDGEPARDPRLGALLRDAVGATPVTEVHWERLAERISVAVEAYHAGPWWSYAERWQRRAIPLALAAGLAGALAFWGTGPTARADAASPDLVSAVVSGTSPADAASSFARAVTGAADLTGGVAE